MPAPGARPGGQVGVQVHVDRAGQMARAVAVDARRPAEPPADIEQRRRPGAGEFGGQRPDVDQRMRGSTHRSGSATP